MSNKFRKLQIAFSVVCGIVCLTLIALWVRSLLTFDCFYTISDTHYTVVWSSEGKVLFNVGTVLTSIPVTDKSGRAKLHSALDKLMYAHLGLAKETGQVPMPDTNFLGFKWKAPDMIVVPYWFPVVLTSVLASLPWIRMPKRFSLRTLLVVMTLVAALLAAIFYAAK